MSIDARLASTTIHDLASRRRRAAAIHAVTSDNGPRARLDAGGTRLRLRALHVMGHGSARIARAVGVREMTIRRLLRGDARTISPRLRDAITAVYDAWWDKRPPERTRAERGAATAAAPSPGTGVRAPPWMTTYSTCPATGPGPAGGPPPEPASPLTLTHPHGNTRPRRTDD